MSAPSVWDLVVRRADASPDRTLLIDERGRTMSARELRAAAERTAAALAARGVGPGTRVSWQLPNVMEAPVLMAALCRLGAVQNPIIPVLRRKEVGFIVEETAAELLIVPETWRGFEFGEMGRDVVADGESDLLLLDLDAAGPDQLALPEGSEDSLPSYAPDAADESPVRWVFYTSGTTQSPKGAKHTDASLIAATRGFFTHLEFTADDVAPIPFPFTHIGGALRLVAQLVEPFLTVLIEAWEPARTPQVMASHGATLLGSAIPFFLVYLAAQREHGPEPLFPRLRACVAGGAPFPPALHYELMENLGGIGIIGGWGLTEFPLATFTSPRSTDEQRAETVGSPTLGVEVRVVTLDGRDAAPGEEGELRLKGPQSFIGYLDERLDADAFDERGFFRTGDLGVVRPDGYVRVTGRLKDIVIRNGENISTIEIEGVLARHPAVADVTALGLPDARTGERCCAVVVLRDRTATLSLAEVAEHCTREGLARFKCPEQLEIRDDLPRNAMGKVVKSELRAQLA